VENKPDKGLLTRSRLEFLLLDPQTTQVLRSNLAARKNLGLSAAQLHQKKITDIDCQLSQTELLDKISALQSGVTSQLDFFSRHRRADNSEYAVRVYIYASEWQNQPTLVALILDISTQKKHLPATNPIEFRRETATYGMIGGWRLSLPEHMFYWTDEVFSIHGLPVETNATVPLDTAMQFYLPESQHRLCNRLDAATADPNSWSEELTLSTAALHKKKLRITCHRQVDDNKVTSLFGSIEDLTEPRQAADDLTGTTLDYEHLVDAAPYGIFLLSAQHRLLSTNASGAVLFHQPAAALIGKNYPQLFHERDQAEARLRLDRAMHGEGSIFELHTQEGRVHAISAYPLVDDDQAQQQIIVISHDVTLSRETEAAITASEKKYRLMIDSSPDMVILHDLDGNIIDANPAACQRIGYTRQELLEKNFAELDNDWVSCHFGPTEQQSGEERQFSDESSLLMAGGGLISCEYHTSVTTLSGRVTVLNFIRDISMRTDRENQRKEMAVRVQQGQKLESLGVLAGGIAHDFNNLLTSMLGNANLATTAQAKNEPISRYLENIESAAIRAGELCTQMLTYAGQGRFAVEETDLNTLIVDMSRLLELAITNKAVVKFQLTKDLPPAAVDPSQIRQALMSMVINASEAIGETSGMVTINTGIMRADSLYLNETYLSENLVEGDYLFIEVNDNGTGMLPEVKERIFDPFFSTKFTGRGLGLAAVLGIVRSHDGALKVYSEEGRGTTFKMLLPKATVKELTHDEGSEKPETLRGSVLIADDEESVASVTAQMVEALGLHATIVTNGRECVDYYQRNPDSVDLVLLDLSMPEMDGAEAFRELKIIDPAARVVLTSGFNQDDAAHRFKGKGLAGFLQKPYHLAELREMLEKVLNS